MAQALTGSGTVSLNWSGGPVDIPRIEAELAALRYAAAGQPAGGQAFALRTSMLNLVVQAPDHETAAEASRAIVGLAGHHPSRALIVIAEPGPGESHVDARLAAHCHRTPGLEQHVCCEEVTLSVRGRAARHLHSIVIPLLVPDLPVFFWWTGPLPKDTHVFEEMLQSADRFIVDSARFREPAVGLRRLAHLCQEEPQCAVGDLNWERLDPWRRLLLQQWESAGLRDDMEKVRDLKLSFAKGDGVSSSAQALLLAGWLAQRLGWDTERAHVHPPHGAAFPAGRKQVSVEIRPRSYEGGAPGELLSVSLRCGREGHGSSVSISRMGSPSHLALHVREGRRTFEEHVLIGPAEQSEMLLRQLDSPSGDSDYAAALDRALPLVRVFAPRDS